MSVLDNSRNFNIVEVKRLYTRQNFAYFNLRDASIVLNKAAGGGKLRKHYDCSSFLMLEKCGNSAGDERPSATYLLGSLNSPLSPVHAPTPNVPTSKDDFRLRVTIQPYNQPLQRRMWEFESMAARDVFVDLLCALVLSGGRAYRVFSSLTAGGSLSVEQARQGLALLGVDPGLLFEQIHPLAMLAKENKLSTVTSPTLSGSPAIGDGGKGTTRVDGSSQTCTCTPPPGLSRTQLAAFRLTHPHNASISLSAGPTRPAPVSPHAATSQSVTAATTPHCSSFRSLQQAFSTLSARVPHLAAEAGHTPSLQHLLAISASTSSRGTHSSRRSSSSPDALASDITALEGQSLQPGISRNGPIRDTASPPRPIAGQPVVAQPPTPTALSSQTDLSLRTSLSTLPIPPPPRPFGSLAPSPTPSPAMATSPRPSFVPRASATLPTPSTSPTNALATLPPPSRPAPVAPSVTSAAPVAPVAPVAQVASVAPSARASVPMSPTTRAPSAPIAPVVPQLPVPSSSLSVPPHIPPPPPSRRALLHQVIRHTACTIRGGDADPSLCAPTYTYSFEAFLLLFLDICSVTAELLQVPLGGPLVCTVRDKKSLADALQLAMVGGIIARATHDPLTQPRQTVSQPSADAASAASSGESSGSPAVSSVRASVSALGLLDGEALLLTSEHAWVERVEATSASAQGLAPRTTLSPGLVALTSYRLIFLAAQGARTDVPLAAIAAIADAPWAGGGAGPACLGGALTVTLKDMRVVKLVLDGVSLCSSLLALLTQLSFPGDQTRLFAFSHQFPSLAQDGFTLTPQHDGWNFYSPEAEYTRVGLPSDDAHFRWCHLNSDYSLSPTYPRIFVVPRASSDEDIRKVARFRSRGRLPVVVYRYKPTGATISRCAQPLVGLIGHSCAADEALVSAIREANSANGKVLHLLDARPTVAAWGNKLQGKGSENVSRYRHAQLQYLGIANIHAMRAAHEALAAALQYNNSVDKTDESLDAVQTHLARVGASQWLYYLSLLLSSAARIAQILTEEAASLTVHCSDGWDRTSQLCALAQLIVDPYFRTKRGFAVLVEKEWLSFGHQFAHRTGHASARISSQRAPIFLQFLDAVYQLQRQSPCAFEFNENYLLALAHHLYTCRFGTFLFDCEAEREEAQLRKKTASVWTYLCHPRTASVFGNACYQEHKGQLLPDCSARRVVVWERLHMKHLPHGPQASDTWYEQYRQHVHAHAHTDYYSSQHSFSGAAAGANAADEGAGQWSCGEAESLGMMQCEQSRVQMALSEALRRCRAAGVDVSDLEHHTHSVGARVRERGCLRDAKQEAVATQDGASVCAAGNAALALDDLNDSESEEDEEEEM